MTQHQSSAPAQPVNGGGGFDIGSFDFHGDPVAVLTNDSGSWAVLGQLCANLELDPRSQQRSLEANCWSKGRTVVTTVQLPGDTQARQHYLIHERIVPMWLANLTASRIPGPAKRAKIERAQGELADALYEYMSSRRPVREPTKLEMARDLVLALEAKEQLEAKNKVLAPKASKWDQFMNTEDLIGMTAIADLLGTDVCTMTGWLVKKNIFRKQVSTFGSRRNMPRRMYQESGFFAVKMETNGKVSYEVAYATKKGADLVFDAWQQRAAA